LNPSLLICPKTNGFYYIIKGWDINCSSQDGIVIRNVNIYFVIKDCYIHNGGRNHDGIVFYNVTNGIIEYNIITRNGNGVMFRSQYPGKENSDNNIISNNSITYNNDGINFEHTGMGWHSMNSIHFNDISSNDRGIYMIMSSENQILCNKIVSNNGYGIQLDMCRGGGEKNIIYHNNFFNNKGEEGQVCELGDPINYWNNSYPYGGNFWSDYNGKDFYDGPNQDIQGSDGIGDLPYNIPGGNNHDKYPLMKPWNFLNNPPNKPSKPVGQINGTKGISYLYTSNTTDPDGDQVYYIWDWGDDSFSQWLGPLDSGLMTNALHSWAKGSYNIRVKAKDIYGSESDWSEPLEVSMPKSKSYISTLQLILQKFFQRFSFFEKILKQYY